jgi:hypothetical protein
MGRFVKTFPELGSFDKFTRMDILVNKFPNQGIFDKNPRI